MLIYFASPIDQVTDSRDFHDKRQELTIRLTNMGHTLFHPHRAWETHARKDAVQMINEAVIDRCDALVAMLPAGIVTTGVPMEIEYACNIGKRVVVWTNYETSPLALSGKPLTVVTTISDVGQAVVRIGTERPFVQSNAKVVGSLHVNRPYADDAGFDLPIDTGGVTIRLRPGQHRGLESAQAVQWPIGIFGLILPRSSTVGRGLLVIPTVIDPGWRGPLFTPVVNISDHIVEVSQGERLAQIVPLANQAPGIVFESVDQLDPSDRGTNGFGSSGR